MIIFTDTNMKKITLILAIGLLFGCRNKNLDEQKKTNKAFFSEELSLFDIDLDDSTILFYSQFRSFDTCFVLQIRRSGENIKGQYLYYPPSYYSDFPTDTKVFLFKGIKFSMTVMDWGRISAFLDDGTRYLQYDEKGASNRIVIHPTTSKCFFKGKKVSNSNNGDAFFDMSYIFLRDSLIKKLEYYYPIVDGRIP
jgi:hypothetical protein